MSITKRIHAFILAFLIAATVLVAAPVDTKFGPASAQAATCTHGVIKYQDYVAYWPSTERWVFHSHVWQGGKLMHRGRLQYRRYIGGKLYWTNAPTGYPLKWFGPCKN